MHCMQSKERAKQEDVPSRVDDRAEGVEGDCLHHARCLRHPRPFAFSPPPDVAHLQEWAFSAAGPRAAEGLRMDDEERVELLESAHVARETGLEERLDLLVVR